MKYIDAEKLIAEIKRKIESIENCPFQLASFGEEKRSEGELAAYKDTLSTITSLQQEPPIEGKQVIIITETDGDANIHWDCRSLDDVEALLKSAESFITEKQIEKMVGPRSGPDYATTEGRFRNAHKFRQEQPEVDLEKELDQWRHKHFKGKRDGDYSGEYLERESQLDIARHFYELGQCTKYQQDRTEFAKLKAKEWQEGYDEGYAKGLNARKEE